MLFAPSAVGQSAARARGGPPSRLRALRVRVRELELQRALSHSMYSKLFLLRVRAGAPELLGSSASCDRPAAAWPAPAPA